MSWYDDPESECPRCGHGPAWHNDETVGCMRMNGPWCDCRRFYSPESTGPDSFVDTSKQYSLMGETQDER